MKVRTAIRKIVKWGGAVGVLLLVVVWVASVFGMLSVGLGPSAGYYIHHGLLIFDYPNGADWTAYFKPYRVNYMPTRPGVAWSSAFGWGPQQKTHNVPLWWPTLLVLIPTAIACWADRRIARRARPGHCPACGYDRRGLAAGGVCPECGAAADAGAAS